MELAARLNQKLSKTALFCYIFSINLQNSCNYFYDFAPKSLKNAIFHIKKSKLSVCCFIRQILPTDNNIFLLFQPVLIVLDIFLQGPLLPFLFQYMQYTFNHQQQYRQPDWNVGQPFIGFNTLAQHHRGESQQHRF